MIVTPTGTKPARIVCKSWCQDGDGHGKEMGIEDQRCESEHTHTPLTLEPMWEASDGSWHQQTLDVWTQGGPCFPLAVMIYETERDAVFTLTPAEARALAAQLIAAAGVAETA